MSNTIDIVFDRKVAGYLPDDRCSLSHDFFEPQFEELARRIEVLSLKAFYSDAPQPLDWQIDDPIVREDLKKQMGPAKFFGPANAMVLIKAFLAELSKAT